MLMIAVFILGLILGGASALLVALWYAVPRLERLYVFRPSRDVLKTPAKLGIPFDQCFVETDDGCRLSAWHVSPEYPIGSIIYFHGNSGNLGILVEILAMFYRHSLQVFALDYRGYGWSTGTPTEHGLYTDALSAVAYFQENFRKPGLPTVFWGRSLGGCVASYAAGKAAPDGLVLETTFASKSTLLKSLPHMRPFQIFSKMKLDTVGHLRNLQVPVLVVHGDKDRTVPFEQGQLLYRRLKDPKEFFRVKGAGHIDIHMLDSENYMKRALAFVTALTPPSIH
jgi:fermentation-respiration switch protein FrsA (DUF1100 family)